MEWKVIVEVLTVRGVTGTQTGSEMSVMLTGYQHTHQLTYNITTTEMYTDDFIYASTAHIIFLHTKNH